jgi:hypothetical protein
MWRGVGPFGPHEIFILVDVPAAGRPLGDASTSTKRVAWRDFVSPSHPFQIVSETQFTDRVNNAPATGDATSG